jgi:purine-binding chemotaxis protein CheW
MSQFHVQFRVGSELYALPVENVLEVAELGDLSVVPGSGPALSGVWNLNGQVLPVFDLARILGVARDGKPSRIVVVEQHGQAAGLAVDEVTEVTSLATDTLEAAGPYLRGAVLEAGRLIGVVDVEQVFPALREAAA